MKIKIVKIKNPKIKCNLHGVQRLVRVTKYGSAECEQCFKDIQDFIKTRKPH